MSAGAPGGAPAPGPAADLLSSPAAGPAAIRGGALRVASFAAGSLFAVAAAAVLFRHLGVVDTGRYTTAVTLGAVVLGLTDLGLTAVGIRELATREGEQRAAFARDLLGMRVALTVAGVAVVTAFAFAVYGPLLGFGVLIAGGGVLVQNVQATLAVPLQARLRLGWVSSLDLARVLVGTAAVVALALLGAGLLAFLAVPALAAACVLAPTALLVRGDVPLRPGFSAARWRALLAPVLTYSLAVAAATLYFRLAIVLVSLLASGRQLGYFSVSYRIVEVLLAVPALLAGAAFPIFARAARDDQARLGYALSRVFEVALILGGLVALALAVGAPLAIEIVGGPGFAPAAPVLAFAAVGLGAAFVTTVWSYALLSLHLHRLILALALGTLPVLGLTVGILTAVDGARGAAIGTAIVELGAATVGGALLVRGRPHLRPRLAVVPKVALALALAAGAALAAQLAVALEVTLAVAVYGAALLALRAVPAEVLDLLPARGRPAGGP